MEKAEERWVEAKVVEKIVRGCWVATMLDCRSV